MLKTDTKPKKVKDCSKGKIYQIRCNVTGKVYIGSTTKTLPDRLTKHESNCKDYLNSKHNYITSFEIIKGGNYNITLIEDYPCKNEAELFAREGHHVRLNKCVNKVIPGRTSKQ